MGEGGGGEEKVSLLHLSPFFASIFPLFPQKRLILRLFFLESIFPGIIAIHWAGYFKEQSLPGPLRV